MYSVPNYRTGRSGDDYAGRNHPGSLIEAAHLLGDQHNFIVLCDPNLIFTREVEFLESLAGESVLSWITIVILSVTRCENSATKRKR